MLRFDHTDTDNVGGILVLAELGRMMMRIKVPTSAEVGWFGYSRINKGGLSVHSYLLHLIIEK
jgi:hypothetical protein